MSNARYRTVSTPAAAEETVTTTELIERAKSALGHVLTRFEQGQRTGNVTVSMRDALAATKQVIAIARLEQRQLERAEKAAKEAAAEAAKVAQQPVQTATTAPSVGAEFAKPLPVDESGPILLPAPPEPVRQAG